MFGKFYYCSCLSLPLHRGVPWGNFLVAQAIFPSHTWPGRGGGGTGSLPWGWGCLFMCDTAMCQVVAYSDSLGSHLDHNLASPHMKPVIPAEIGGCNFSSFVIPSVISKKSEYATKTNCYLAWWRYLFSFCLLVPGIHLLMLVVCCSTVLK